MAIAFDQATVQDVALAIIAISGAYTAFLAQKAKPVLDSIKSTGEANHTLSNSAMGAQLTMGVEDAEHALAQAKTISAARQSPGDVDLITQAALKVEQRKQLLQDHLIQQAKVDAMDPKPPVPKT